MKKYLTTLFVGFAIFLIGFAWFYIETMDYEVSSSLTSNFDMNGEAFEYEITLEEKVRITNSGTDKNMKLYIDNHLSNEVRIVVVHPKMVNVKSNVTKRSKGTNITVRSDIAMDFDSIKDLYDFGVIGIKNKTIYNYTLFQYPEVRVFVNENFRNNVEFVGSGGNVYNPIK